MVDAILIEYDVNGAGVSLDFDTFNNDFLEYKTGKLTKNIN